MISNAEVLNKLNFFAEPGFKEELLKHGQLASFNKGDVIVRDGQYVKFLPIVLKGAIRVFQQSEDREILLYYVRVDETCTMALAAAYFNNKRVPNKTHRYGPFYSYFYGLYHAANDYVFHIDSDIFFGGSDPNWIIEAVGLLKSERGVVTCSPFPGPPTVDGKLLDQSGKMDNSELRKVYFDSFSTRLFVINKESFTKMICPMPIKIAEWPLLYRALLRFRPIFELPEDTITHIMREKGLKRIDFLGTGEGIWSLHPPFRNEEFFEKLPLLIEHIEAGNIPDAQRGYYDLNDSMIDWSDAREAIKQASLKRQLLKKMGIKPA